MSQIQPLNKTAFSDYRSTCVKHLQTVWLIMAQFKAFTRGRLHPTLPLAEKRLWSSHSGKAQLSKKGKPDYMTQHQNGGQIQIQISGGHCIKPFYQYSRVRNKCSPTIINFLTFFQGLRPYSGLHSIR